MCARARVPTRFGTLDHKLSRDDYNFTRFRAKHLLSSVEAIIAPGEIALDFTFFAWGRQ